MQSLLLSKPFDNESDSNRRNDQDVRYAIEKIQTLLFDPQAARKVFPLLLQHTEEITNSDFGVILVADEDCITPIKNKEMNDLHCIHSDKGVPFIQPSILEHWINQNLLLMRPIYFNNPIPKKHTQLLLHPEQVSSIVILPIISHNQLQSICILGKRSGEYNAEALTRLRPLLGSVVCALQTAESVKGNLLSLNQKISDNQFLSTLLSTSPIAIIVVRENKEIIVSNPKAYAMLHTDKAEPEAEGLEGKMITEFIPKFDDLFKWSNQRAPYGDELRSNSPRVWEDQTAYRVDKSPFIVNISVFRYTYGATNYTALQIQDITSMRESAEEYHLASQELSALTHLVPVGIIRVDSNWCCIYGNDRWYEFSGLTHEESKGPNWINALHSDDVTNILERVREALQVGREYQAELRLVSPLGKVRWVDFNARVLFDEHGTVQGFLATFADITERLLYQERLRHVAEYDSLTGLANRNLFQDRLKQAFYLSERDELDITLFFLDLDGFKDINDSLGHEIGDQLLKQVAERLTNTLRRSDTIARFGGDEFVVLLSPMEKTNDISSVASKVIKIIAKPYSIEGNDAYVTASIGVATGKSTNSSAETILKQADAALYLAKAEGKNNFQLFNDDLDKEAKKRIYLASQLRVAQQQNSYFLVYQPQASVVDKNIIGFEALLRFKDSEKQTVMPNVFIPILEETGMILSVGQWVINECCRQLRKWINQGVFPKGGFLSINVSPKQLLDESIISVILNSCNRYQVEPEQLVIEITETVIIDKPKKVQKAIASLKAIGVQLALDDFGTGYSSLTYLQQYPFDHIKIDKSFISDLVSDKNDVKITKAIIALAQSLGLRVTAEGVADVESLGILSKYGADYYQGYFLGKPAPADEAIKYSHK